MYLGSYLTKSDVDGTIISETLDREFKEFSLKQVEYVKDTSGKYYIPDRYIINEHDMKKIIRTKDMKLYLEKSKKILGSYIKKYITKYCATFSNTRDLDSANFYMGVSDDSQLSGIPMYKNMKEDIKEKIIYEIKKLVGYQKDFNKELYTEEYIESYVKDIIKNVEIEIIELKSDETYLPDELPEILTKYKKDYKEYLMKKLEYKKKRKDWIQTVEWHRRSVNKMIKDKKVRIKMQQFVREYNVKKYKQIYFANIIDKRDELTEKDYSIYLHKYMKITSKFDEIKENIITILENDSEYFNEIKTSEILENRCNPENITYWITQFRDNNVDKLMKIKPRKKIFIEPMSPYLKVIKNFTLFTRETIKEGMKYCIIKIKFPGKNKLKKYLDLIHYDVRGNIRLTKRELDDNGFPCCI